MDKNSRTVLFSISSNALPPAVKPMAGVLTGSISVLSEAIHSATDLVAVRRSNSPPDEDHNYGYGRYENLAVSPRGSHVCGILSVCG